jgi:hypothetical protein
MRTLAVLTTTLLLALSGSSQAVCRFDSGKIFFGAETPMRGEADSGKPCGFEMSSALSSRSGSFRVAQPPLHGVAGIGDNGGMPVVAYRSAAGYRGSDEFVVSFMGGDIRLREAPSAIHVYIDVK